MVKESACNGGDLGSIPGFGRSAGEGNGYPLQYSCLENSMTRGGWQAIAHGVAKSRTRLSDFHYSIFRREHNYEQMHVSMCIILWVLLQSEAAQSRNMKVLGKASLKSS